MAIRASGPDAGAKKGGGEDNLAALLRRVAARDEAAFAALYHLTSAKLFGVITCILSRADGADSLQDTYVRIWENASDFDPSKGSPFTWMATIARNRALDEVRRARPVSLEDQPQGFEPAAEDVDPLAARERSEALTALVDCLKALDEEKRAVVLLAYYRGLSHEALAKHFNRPVPTIKTWLRRSLGQLRDGLVLGVSPHRTAGLERVFQLAKSNGAPSPSSPAAASSSSPAPQPR